MFRPAIRASGVSVCSWAELLSQAQRSSCESMSPSWQPPEWGYHYHSTEQHSVQLTAHPGQKPQTHLPRLPQSQSHFPGCKRTFPFKHQHQLVPGAGTWQQSLLKLCVACHNAQKPSAILQQAALTAGNKPRSAFPKDNPLFKCTNMPHTLGRQVLLPTEHQDDDRTLWTHLSRIQLGVCHPSAPRPPEPCRTFCRCWSSHIQHHTELPETHENSLNRT